MAFDENSKHKYEALEAWIRSAIREGTFTSGQKIPSENRLAEQFNISRQTVRLAIRHLEEGGVLVSRRGSGTYVSDKTKAGLIGYVATNISDYIFPQITSGIEEILSGKGYNMTLGVTKNRVEIEQQLLKSLMNQGIDGIIIEGNRSALPNPNLPLYRLLTQRGIPYVFINGYYKDLDPVFVVTNDRLGGQQAVKHLYELGHRRIGGIFKGDDRQGHERYAGFSEQMVIYDLPLNDDEVIWYTTADLDHLFLRSEEGRLLKRLGKCTAVVCYNDQIAMNIIKLFQKNHLRVPEDKSVMGFDDSTLSELSPVRITTLRHPAEMLGRQAAWRLLDMIETGKTALSLTMDMELIIKDSTAAPPLGETNK